MSDQFLLFLLLVLPALVAALLIYLGMLVVGLGPILAVSRSAPPAIKGVLMVLGVMVILSPVIFHAGMNMRAQHMADQRQAHLAQLERTNLAGRLPTRFIAVGFTPELVTFIQERFGLRTYPEAENKRLAEAYRAYRRAEWCHRRFPGNQMMPGTKLPRCRPLPDSVQSALGLSQPLLVFAEGHNTSMREDNVLAGEVYEIRLISPEEDLLVAYYEERTLEDKPHVFNPYASGRRNASEEPPPTLEEFIETAMEEASR